MSRQGRLGVSVVTYRSPLPALRLTLEAVAASVGVDVQLRLHANATSQSDADELRALAAAAAPGLLADVTWSAENLGFAGAHNRSLASLFASGCDAVVVLNPDLMLLPDALAALSSAAVALGGRALLGPLLELADPVTLAGTGLADTCGIRWTWDGRHLDDGQGEPLPVGVDAAPHRVAGVSGACLFVTRAVHDAVVATTGEFFDEDFIAYREDAELAYRAQLLGIDSWVVPAARGRHARRLRGTSRGLDPQIDRLGVRNRFLIAYKFGRRRPGRGVGPYLRDGVVILGVLAQERSSLPGLVEAWRLRGAMRAKRRALLVAA